MTNYNTLKLKPFKVLSYKMVVDGCLIDPHLFCNPVLGNAKAVHAEYLDVRVHLGGGFHSCCLVGVPSVGPVQQAVETGPVRAGLHLNGITGNPIPDVFGKHAHPPGIYPFSGINRFIQNN
jgi:hypothetical protein